VLMSVFKKPLHWVEEKYHREGLLDAIHKIRVSTDPIGDPLAWVFVIKGKVSYYDMPFQESEFIVFSDWNSHYVTFEHQGLYAVLTQQDSKDLGALHQVREV
jgi:hypothetical protein